MFRSIPRLAAAIFAFAFAYNAQPALAGCGCEKPPPVPARIRPNVAHPGTEITLFHPGLEAGASYWVDFASGTEIADVRVEAVADVRRDQADAVAKTQLSVVLPELPLGPTSVTVIRGDDDTRLLQVGDHDLTVAPYPVTVPDGICRSQFLHYQAAVSRDGIVYISLDLSELKNPKSIQAQAKSLPLRFDGDDVVFYNTQGFVMQRMDASIPGLYSIDSPSDLEDSDILHYSRHEFVSFYAMHEERQAHQLDADDPNWHLDGSPHIDHDNMILAIDARLPDGSIPEAGATRRFKLDIRTLSLFDNGLVGDSYVDLRNNTSIHSYSGAHDDDGEPEESGAEGDVLTNGVLSMKGSAAVNGSATASVFDIGDPLAISGEMTTATESKEFLPVYVPSALPSQGSLTVHGSKTVELVGPATFRYSSLTIRPQARLSIDNSAGPVVIYVDGPVQVEAGARIVPTNLDPEMFALYVNGPHTVSLVGDSAFYGVVYAPDALIDLSGQGQFYGAFVGYGVKISDEARVHYDEGLRKRTGPTTTTKWDGSDPGAGEIIDTDSESSETTTTSSTDTTSGNGKRGKGKANGKGKAKGKNR